MKLAYAKDDGVAIVTAVPREVLEPLIGEPNALGVRTLSHDDYVAHVLERNGLAAEEVVRLPDNWQPPAAPRASWVLTEMGEIGVDAQKASAIYRQSYGAVIDRHINATAQAKGYDSAVSLVSYRFDEVQSVWAAEAEAFFSWRSQVWEYAIAQLASVLAGARPPAERRRVASRVAADRVADLAPLDAAD